MFWPISCPSSGSIALQANYKPNCQVYMLCRELFTDVIHYASIIFYDANFEASKRWESLPHESVAKCSSEHNTTHFRTQLPYTRRDVDIDFCDLKVL